MRQGENQQTSVESAPKQCGGAAPESRRCQYRKADGKGCRDWAVRGQDFCYRHGVFLRGARGIDVPLLEDESSIVLVLSETLRAVAMRAMPTNDGRLLLDGCRLAHSMHMDRLAAARLERGRGALEAADDEREEERETEAGSGAKAEDECGAPCAEPCDECAKPVAELVRDREEKWSEERRGVVGKRSDLVDSRYGESLAAQAAPQDETREEEASLASV
jgi:hypothetical protein